MNPQDIEKIIENHQGELGALISILEDVQTEYHYLPEDALRMIAGRTGRSLVDIYGVATFYKAFSLKPRGKHLISVCLGTACHVRSAPGIVEEFTQQLGISPGETTRDNELTLETVNCLGTCALGPIVVVDGHYFSNVKRSDVKKIIQKTRTGTDKIDTGRDEKLFPVEVCCPYCNHNLMDNTTLIDTYPSIALGYSSNMKRGRVNLSSLYGSDSRQTEHDTPPDTPVRFYCPHCQAQFSGTSICIECGSPTVPLRIQGGGTLLICTSWECGSNTISLNGFASPVIRQQHAGISLPG